MHAECHGALIIVVLRLYHLILQELSIICYHSCALHIWCAQNSEMSKAHSTEAHTSIMYNAQCVENPGMW